VEELEERDHQFSNTPQRVEIRVNGPDIYEASTNYWIFEVQVNILILSHMDGTVDNALNGVEMAGVLAARAAELINVIKYGSGVDDDGVSSIGCLRVLNGQRDSIKVFHFGEVDTVHRLRQLSVDTSYHMTLCLTGEE
jgi:hypothetical protein